MGRSAPPHESPHGRIEVAWQVVDGSGRIDVTEPAGTETELVLPDGTEEALTAGFHQRV